MKSIGAFLGRFFTSGYGWAITVFFIWQVVFAVGALDDWWPEALLKGGVEEAVTASLVVSVHIMVAVNTLVFLLTLSPLIAPIPGFLERAGTQGRGAQDKYRVFVVGLVISTFVAGMMALLILSRWAGATPGLSWRLILRLNEVVCALVFFCFVLADTCGYLVCQMGLENEKCLPPGSCGKLRKAAGDVSMFILGVDIPGLMGVLFIACVSDVVFRDQVNGHFWQGFVAGAIGLHVAFSQAALALLASWESETEVQGGQALRERAA